MENSKIKENFREWENWRGGNLFMKYKERKSKNGIPRTAPARSCLRLKIIINVTSCHLSNNLKKMLFSALKFQNLHYIFLILEVIPISTFNDEKKVNRLLCQKNK